MDVRKGAKKLVWSVLRIALFTVLLLLFMLLFFEEKLMYFPSRGTEVQLMDAAGVLGVEPWRNGKGEFIGWKSRPALGLAQARCLVIHGNAGMALDRIDYVEGLQALPPQGKWEIYILEYPGYGFRSGKPGQEGMVAAAVEALDLLKDADTRPVFVVGESIGSGVACQLAKERPDRVSGLLLKTPFSRMSDVAWVHYPVLPWAQLFPVMSRNQYDSMEALSHYDGPVAVMVAMEDRVIPPYLGQRLYESYKGPKKLWQMENAGHNTIDFSPLANWWQEVFGYLEENAVYTRL